MSEMPTEWLKPNENFPKTCRPDAKMEIREDDFYILSADLENALTQWLKPSETRLVDRGGAPSLHAHILALPRQASDNNKDQ